MLNKLSFNLMNSLNESETKTYQVKKKVIVESTGTKTIVEEVQKPKISQEAKDSFTSLKDIIENDDNKINVNGFWLSDKAVAIIKSSNTNFHLNSYMNLNISDIINMVKDNDTIEQAIDELYTDYDSNSAYSWAENFISVLENLNFDIENNIVESTRTKTITNESKENKEDLKVKTYHMEDLGGNTMAVFGQLENGLYFAGNEDGIRIYDIDTWPYHEGDGDKEFVDWYKLENEHNIEDYEYGDKEFKDIMLQTGFKDEDYFNTSYYNDDELDESVDQDIENAKKDSIEKGLYSEADESIGTLNVELNTDVLPLVDVNMYSMDSFISDYDITLEELDDVTKEKATPFIEKSIKEILPSANIESTKVYHPKEYNYSGDELEFTLSFDKSEYEALKEKTLNNKNFDKFLKDNYASTSNFISNMADNKKDFETQEEWKQVAQVIMFNIPEGTINNNNEAYINDFVDYVSGNFQEISGLDEADESTETVENTNTVDEFENMEESYFLEYLAAMLGIEEEDIFDAESRASNIVSNWGEPLEYDETTGYSLNVIDGSKIEGCKPVKAYYIVIDQDENEGGDYAYELFDNEKEARDNEKEARDKYNALTNKIEESSLTEAKLTDYLGIMQIKDLLNKNKKTANKEFAIVDNMEIQVGKGKDAKVYKAIKNDDGEWELEFIKNFYESALTGADESCKSLKEDTNRVKVSFYVDTNQTPKEEIQAKLENLLANSGLASTKEDIEIEDDLDENCKSLEEDTKEMEVNKSNVIKSQGNIHMIEADGQYIVGEDYNSDTKELANAEVYEDKEAADVDYLNRCEISTSNK
jgi:hypothetical protein